jgi:microcompartment protein CcmK/EutM
LFLGKVVGSVWTTRKDENLSGFKLQFIQLLNRKREKAGDPIVAVDAAGAGPGETVFSTTTREAAIPLPIEMARVDASIVGIVDRIDLEEDVKIG